MSQKKDLPRFYHFKFEFQGIPGEVYVAPAGAHIELSDGRQWDSDNLPGAVAVAVLKARLQAARNRTLTVYGFESQVPRETPAPASRSFVQVAEAFDVTQLALAPEPLPPNLEHCSYWQRYSRRA